MTNARAVHCAEHTRHVGVCPACQRARLDAEKRQEDEVNEIAARGHVIAEESRDGGTQAKSTPT